MKAKRRTGAARSRRAATQAKDRKRPSRGANASSGSLPRISLAELERMKQASRDVDAADFASGRKSAAQLYRENGHFAGLRVRVDYKSCKHPK